MIGYRQRIYQCSIRSLLSRNLLKWVFTFILRVSFFLERKFCLFCHHSLYHYPFHQYLPCYYPLRYYLSHQHLSFHHLLYYYLFLHHLFCLALIVRRRLALPSHHPFCPAPNAWLHHLYHPALIVWHHLLPPKILEMLFPNSSPL